MSSFFAYMFTQVSNLLNLWQDTRVTRILGANFLYIMLSAWIIWLMVNIFIVHPPVAGPLWDVQVQKDVKSKWNFKVNVPTSGKIGSSTDYMLESHNESGDSND